MIVVSLGYYAVKGGGFVLLTGGHSRVYGPADSMIGETVPEPGAGARRS